MATNPSVYNYTDFRQFLLDYYELRKKQEGSYSYRAFATEVGCNSPNLMFLIVSGKRNLTKTNIPKVAALIGMGKREQHYFDALVSFNQAKTDSGKDYYFQLLNRLKGHRITALIAGEQFEYISLWYYPVIREMVLLEEFEERPEWIAAHLKGRVTVGEAKTALEALLRLGLLKRDENGKLVHVDKHITTGNEVAHVAAYEYHQQMLDISKDILAKSPPNRRDYSSLVMAVSKTQFEELKQMIHDFEETVIHYINDHPDKPEAVYQLNVQFIPAAASKQGGLK